MEAPKFLDANVGICAVQPEIAIPVITEGLALITLCGWVAVAAG
ncbi:hypothetical protein [Niallia sp. 01092]